MVPIFFLLAELIVVIVVAFSAFSFFVFSRDSGVWQVPCLVFPLAL